MQSLVQRVFKIVFKTIMDEKQIAGYAYGLYNIHVQFESEKSNTIQYNVTMLLCHYSDLRAYDHYSDYLSI